MRHHEWAFRGPDHDWPGESRWECRRCGTRESSIDKPWVDRTSNPSQDPSYWAPDGLARRVSFTFLNCGGGPGLANVLSDCDLEAVRLVQDA